MTLSCSETEARLVDVIDGRLDPPLEMRVHAHLEGCAACRQRAELWRTLVPRLRGLSPAPPADLGARRLEVEILRQLHSAKATRARLPRRGLLGAGALATLAVAAALALWLHPRAKPTGENPAEAGYAFLTRVAGSVTSGGRALAANGVLSVGVEIEIAGAGEAELRMARGSVLRLAGPARLALGGTPRQVALRLEQGTLEAEVAHRLAGETFAVATRDARVEVRGTHFLVGAEADRSWVRVVEGLVAVELGDGMTRMVGAGEEVATGGVAPPVAPARTEVGDGPGVAPEPAAAAPSCAGLVRSCEGTTRAARESMRGGDDARALRLVLAASRATRDSALGCGREIAPCDDELRYLRAEALRGAGRFDAAVAAYKSISRAGAPAAMRQNALYAAAEIERRRGLKTAAREDYEGALAAAPRGALGEEALVGAMETAALAGDGSRARALAERYLSDFPHGRSAPAARRLADSEPAR